MKSLMQQALGADWDRLPPALQAHYRFGTTTDIGHLDIEFPRFMWPLLLLLRLVGALVHRRGRGVATRVEKQVVGERQYWRRRIVFPDGRLIRFNSFWVAAGPGQVIEYVNTVCGLQMAPYVEDGRLHYRGVHFVVKLGPLVLPIPEWLLLGHTTIIEVAIDECHFAMDFRLTHPFFGEVFRYAGVFAADWPEAGQAVNPAVPDRSA